MSDEFSDYDRGHPFQREFTRLFNQHAGAHPDKLARGCIEALFDYLLNPPELDPKQDGSSGEDVVGPFEDEARQVEAKLLGMVRDEATAVCEFIRRHTSGG